MGRRILKALRALAIAGVAGLGALLATLWLEHRSVLELPRPTGPYAVGRAISVWSDAAHPDPLAPPGANRELLVWIWYPSAAPAAPDDYVPAALRAPAGHAAPLIFRLLTRDVSKVHSHSARDPALSPRERSYPVIIMRAGASAPVVNYTTLAEDLASHGYVVVGFDAPYRTSLVVFPDGRAIERLPRNNPELFAGAELERLAEKLLAAWTADIAFVLDRLSNLNASDPAGRFTARLDLARVGVFGHSFGGATAAQFCARDDRCQAGIDVDGSLHGSVIQTGIGKPFLFLLSGHGDFSSDAQTRQIIADIQAVYDRLPSNGRLRLEIRGANHFTFSDDGALLKSGILRGVLRLTGMLGIDGRRQLAVTAHCVRAFFDAYLKGASGAPPQLASPLYPELQVRE